jgi:hypothetical protein
MSYDKQITELIEEIVKLPTLEERMEALNTILGSLHNQRRQFRNEDDSVTKENMMLPLNEIELDATEIVERYPHMKERMADFEEGYEDYVLLEQMPEHAGLLIQNGRENQLDIEILEPNPDGTVFLHLQPTPLCEDCAVFVELATDLAAYLADRAIVEGVRSKLTVEFFVEELRAGVTTFFGIQIEDDDDGVPVIVHDTEEPYDGYFDAWMGRVTVH